MIIRKIEVEYSLRLESLRLRYRRKYDSMAEDSLRGYSLRGYEVTKNEILTMWFLYEKEMEKQYNYTVFS